MIDYQKAFYNLCNLTSVEYTDFKISNELSKNCRCGNCNEYVAINDNGNIIANSDSIDDFAEQLSKIEIDW